MTSLILNSKAVCCMHMGNFEEAETLLLDALNKVSDDEPTLSYSVSCHQLCCTRFLNQAQTHQIKSLNYLCLNI